MPQKSVKTPTSIKVLISNATACLIAAIVAAVSAVVLTVSVVRLVIFV